MRNEELIPQKDLDAIKQLEASLKSIASAILKVAEDVQAMSEALRKTDDTKERVKNLSAAEKELNRLSKERATLEARKTEIIKKAAAENAKLRTEVRLQTKEYAANSNTIEGLRTKVARLTDTWKNAERGTKEYRKALRELSSAQKELSKEEAKGGIFGRNVGNYPKFLSGLKGIAGWGAAIAALGSILKNATKTIIEFEQANANLATILGKSASEITDLTNSAKQLGATTEWMAAQVTELQTELAKLGFNELQIQNMQASVLQFATAMGADLGSAAALAGASLRAFNLDSTETERVTAVMTVGANKSALSFSYLEAAMSTIAPVARTFGFGIEDTVALLGTLANAGFDASSAATATRNILLNLADSKGKLAKTLGQPVRNLDEMATAFKALRDKGVDLATTLELTDKRSVAAFNTFLQGSESLITLRGELNNVDGELKRIQQERLNTVEGSVKLLNSAWEGLMLSFSNSKGYIKIAVDALTALINTINRAVDPGGARSLENNQRYQDRVKGMVEMRKSMIDGYKTLGKTEEDANKRTEELLDEQEKRLTDHYRASLKHTQFYSEDDLNGKNGRKAQKAAEQANQIYKDAARDLNDFMNARVVAKDSYNLDQTTTTTTTGGVTVSDDKGAKAAEKALEQRLQKEREAIRKNMEAEYEMRQAANKRIVDDEKRTFEERSAALERFYVLEEEKLTKSATLQTENLILTEMEKSNVDRTTAIKNVAAETKLVETTLQASLSLIVGEKEDERTKLLQHEVQKRIRIRAQELAKSINDIDAAESSSLKDASDRYAKGITNEVEYQQEITDIQADATNQRHTAELQALRDELNLIPFDNEEDRAKAEERIARKLVDINKWKDEQVVKSNEKSAEDRKRTEEQVAQYSQQIASEMLNFMGAIFAAQTERRLAALDKELEAAQEYAESEIERIDGLYEAGSISEEQANAQKLAEEQKLRAKEKEIEAEKKRAQTEQAKRDKAMNIAQITMDTAVALVAAWKHPSTAPIVMGLIAALGAVQLATVMATPIPEYATGTDYHPGGLAVLGDGGRSEAVLYGGLMYKTDNKPFIADLPKGAQVLPDYNMAVRDMILSSTLENGRMVLPDRRVEATLDDRAIISELRRIRNLEMLMAKQIALDERRARDARFKEFKNRRFTIIR